MGLNISKGNMYSFVDATWNIIKGACYHDCSYCFMKRWGGDLKPARFDNKELKEFERDMKKYGEGLTIFVGSSCDMFSEAIPNYSIKDVLSFCDGFNNKYLFQTKNPKRLLDFRLPKSVICTTIESDLFYPEIMRKSPTPYERAKYMEMISMCGFETYVTIEPIIDFNMNGLLELVQRCKPEQVNIGANSGKVKLPEPGKEKVLELIKEINCFSKVHNKTNLQRIINN